MIQNKEKILVTGATGFVGSHLAHRLVAEGHDVHVLIREHSDMWRIKNIVDKITVHEGELSNKNSIASIIDTIKPEGVFHMAALTITSGMSEGALEMVNVNLLGTINLIDALSQIEYKFFINAGSFIEYRGENRPVTETDLCEPKEVYSITKLGATLYAKATGVIKNKPIITFRLFTPYGPLIQSGKLIEQIILNPIKGKLIKLTRPAIARDFIFIDDLIDLFVEAAGKAHTYKGEIFNAGSGVKTTIKELSDYVFSITDSASEVVWNESAATAYDLDSWQADMTKTFSSFDWRPQYTLAQGVTKMIDFYKNSH